MSLVLTRTSTKLIHIARFKFKRESLGTVQVPTGKLDPPTGKTDNTESTGANWLELAKKKRRHGHGSDRLNLECRSQNIAIKHYVSTLCYMNFMFFCTLKKTLLISLNFDKFDSTAPDRV